MQSKIDARKDGLHHPFLINTYMRFNIFKRKKKIKDTSKTYEGRVITDEEIQKMIQPKSGNFITKDLNEINRMMENIREKLD